MCPGRTAVVQQLWRRDVTSPFPPSGNGGYASNLDVPYQSVTFDVTSEWLTNGIPGKRHYCWPPPVLCRSRQVPPHQLGWKIGQGLGRDNRTAVPPVGRITLGKRTPSRGKRYGATSRIRRYHVEITRMDWPRAVPHTGVSEVDPARLGWDSYTAEKAEVLPGKTRAHQGGEPYRGRIHMWDHQGESLHMGT